MKTALITTTINVPHNLRAWADQLDDEDVIIVAGDQRTPHNDVKSLLDDLPRETVYLHPNDQEKWRLSQPTGWNCVQRRNFALLEALTRQPDIIITVDDDNYPVADNHITRVRKILDSESRDYSVLSSQTGWWNAGAMLQPPAVHRGFPLSRRNEVTEIMVDRHDARIGVFASLWLGDPDVDALERACHNPEVYMIAGPNTTLELGTWCPFNSQATAYRAELAPLMMVWPHVGRYDDIWASYLARRVMDHLGWHVQYGEPAVRQERNQHDLVHDLEQELDGYRYTEELCAVLRDVKFTTTNVIDCLRECYVELARTPAVLLMTIDAWDAWLKDLGTLEIT